MIKRLLKRIFNWIFSDELEELKKKSKDLQSAKNKVKNLEDRLENILDCVGIGADINPSRYSPSWAVICVQGKPNNYVQFVSLDVGNVMEIERFLRRFETRSVIDVPLGMRKFFKC